MLSESTAFPLPVPSVVLAWSCPVTSACPSSTLLFPFLYVAMGHKHASKHPHKLSDHVLDRFHSPQSSLVQEEVWHGSHQPKDDPTGDGAHEGRRWMRTILERQVLAAQHELPLPGFELPRLNRNRFGVRNHVFCESRPTTILVGRDIQTTIRCTHFFSPASSFMIPESL